MFHRLSDNVSQGSADAGPKPVAAAPGSDKAFPRGSHCNWVFLLSFLLEASFVRVSVSKLFIIRLIFLNYKNLC